MIRAPTTTDIDQLLQLCARMHQESAYSFLPFDPDKVRRLVTDVIERGELYCGLVADDGGVLIGMLAGYLADYMFCDEQLACDLLVFVDPPYRGGWTAVRLISTFRAWALGRGARELCLGVSTEVDVDTTGKFYERLGFSRVGGVYKQRLK